ncbi:MAG TPA: hypothetical protein VI037_06315, partial [Nitrososphaera sp.]
MTSRERENTNRRFCNLFSVNHVVCKQPFSQRGCRVPIPSDIVHEVFNRTIKIKVSFEIIDGLDTTSTSIARKPDLLTIRILSYEMVVKDNGGVWWARHSCAKCGCTLCI